MLNFKTKFGLFSHLKSTNMTKYILLIVLFTACTKPYVPHIRIVDDFNEIASLFTHDNDTTYVINFWATTCPPCIKEMPHFEKLAKKYNRDKLQITMISLDSKRRIDQHVMPFLHKLHIENPVIVLTDANYTEWTAKINPKWFGALPYTVIYNGEKIQYFFGAFDNFGELDEAVSSFIK